MFKQWFRVFSALMSFLLITATAVRAESFEEGLRRKHGLSKAKFDQTVQATLFIDLSRYCARQSGQKPEYIRAIDKTAEFLIKFSGTEEITKDFRASPNWGKMIKDYMNTITEYKGDCLLVIDDFRDIVTQLMRKAEETKKRMEVYKSQ